MRFFIDISYIGSRYCGWQEQPNGLSVQQLLQDKLGLLLGHPIKVVGAGRTDSGVHAQHAIAHFDSDKMLPPKNNLIRKMNALLPHDIAVHTIKAVHASAHARFDALKRTYQYRIGTKKNVFRFGQYYFLPKVLDVEAMNKCAQLLMTNNNFKCFAKSKTDVATYLCKISNASWVTCADEYIFTISANRFLRNMVRAIVGTIIEVGLGKQKWYYLDEIIKKRDRTKAGFSAPAHGLSLVSVDYPNEIFL